MYDTGFSTMPKAVQNLWILLIVAVNKGLMETIISCIVRLMSVTYQPKKRKRAKTHGFLVRSATKTGKRVLASRRRKGRAKLTTV